MRPYAVILSLAVVLGGCAQPYWRKEGADREALRQDLAQCSQEARLRAERYAWPGGPPATRIIGVDAYGVPIVAYSYSFESERFILEHDFTRSCMLGKGYRLAPADARDGRKVGDEG